ncbi:GNAT family N-acetyltransferase, partial [Rhizobium ruizarguesonis]
TDRTLFSSDRLHIAHAGCGYLSFSAATGNVLAHRFYEQLDFTARPVTGMLYMQSIA